MCHTLTFALEVLPLQKEVLHRCVKTHPISKDIVKSRRQFLLVCYLAVFTNAF